MRRAVFACAAGAILAGLPSDTFAQTPDSTANPGVGNCVLEWGAPPGGRAPALRHTQDDSGEVADFFSGRTLFTCGSATMLADSAVSYETRGEVYLVGNVVYQDSLRSLESTYLTYFERVDLVVADEDVRLVRSIDRSTLEGPHVEFLRAVSGIDELTTATGRPHMTLYPKGDDPGPPFEVDADRTVFAGEDEARAYGDVVIDREDLKGEADSVRLRRTEETGEMWGDPWIEAEGVRLEGEKIDFRSENDVLQDVHAIGDGRAVGESFEVMASIIDIDLVDEEPERVWAHGAGLSRALSGAHNVYGDSLEFAMFEGAIDTVYAVGDAIALQGDEPAAAVPDSASGAVADSAAAGDPVAVLEPPVPVVDTSAIGVDTVAVAPVDSTAATDPPAPVVDSSMVTLADSGLVAPSDTSGAVPADSAVVPADSAAVPPAAVSADSANATVEADEEQDVDPAAGGPVQRPRLRVDGRATWVSADTVLAIFERPGGPRSPSPEPLATTLPSPPDSAFATPTVAEAALGPVDSLVVLDAVEAPPDSAPAPVMERLIAIGNARSLFSQVRDSTRTTRESRNYMIGKRIEITFEDGEPAHVKGEEAIGVFLDPEDIDTGPPGRRTAAPVLPDSLTVAADSIGMPPDTTGMPPDTTGVPPDTTSAPADSTRVRQDTTSTATGARFDRRDSSRPAEPMASAGLGRDRHRREPVSPARRERTRAWAKP